MPTCLVHNCETSQRLLYSHLLSPLSQDQIPFDPHQRRPDHGKGASDNEDVVLLQPELLAIRALEGVQMEGPEKDILREICQGNQRGDQEEPVAKAARELWQAASKTVHSTEWLEEEGLLQFRGKIYVPQNADL